MRVDRVGLVNCVTSYSAGTERTASAQHSDFTSYNVDHHQQAWMNNLPSGDTPTFPMGKPPLPPLSRGSNFSDTSSPQHMLSKKEENLSEEWLVDLILSYSVIAELLVTLVLRNFFVDVLFSILWFICVLKTSCSILSQ